MEKIRKPIASGQFYEGSGKRLEESIKNCFLSERGPGKLPEIKKGDKTIRGVVVPHAGFVFSGSIAAYSFQILAENGFADTFILLGPNHTGLGSGVAAMTEGNWRTPLGDLSINKDLADKIVTGIIEEDETAHRNEHSIEVQLPFIQYIANNSNIDFVPICMSMQDYKTSDRIGSILANTLKDCDRKTVIVASSDFSHVGFNYMSMPPAGEKVNEYAEKQDRKAIDRILELDAKGLIETVEKENISMCGYGPVASMIIASKKLGAEKAEFLKYGTSHDVHPGSSCVGYGAISVY